MSATDHAFDDAMRLEPLSRGRMRGRTTEDYANMVGPFGGITAATLMRAVEMQPDRLGDPVALTVNFLTAIAPGEFDVVTRCVRSNRSTQHWYVEILQDDVAVSNATAVTAVHRQTWSETEVTRPEVPPPAELALAGEPPMEWPKQYEMRFAKGPLRFDGVTSDDSTTTLWVRDNPPRPLDFASLTAACDVFFPRVYVRTGKASPVGTVSMTVYFHADAEELARHGDDYILATARGSRYDRGFFDQTAQLWGRKDSLLATTHQIVYFKD